MIVIMDMMEISKNNLDSIIGVKSEELIEKLIPVKGMVDINKKSFLLFAAKTYDSVKCIISEFETDLKRFKYVKKLLRRYKQTGVLKERLILNHIIILSNVFGTENAVRMLFYKIYHEDYDVLKTFLLFLNYMPNKVKSIDGMDIISANIPVNLKVVEILRKV